MNDFSDPENYSGLSRWIQYNHKSPYKMEAGRSESVIQSTITEAGI